MDHYLEIRVLPDPEFNEEMLMAALMAKLHRALGLRGQGDIGISFPAHGIKPGPVLRLHGTHPALSELESLVWRKGLSDYCMSSDIQPVPVVKPRPGEKQCAASDATLGKKRMANGGGGATASSDDAGGEDGFTLA